MSQPQPSDAHYHGKDLERVKLDRYNELSAVSQLLTLLKVPIMTHSDPNRQQFLTSQVSHNNHHLKAFFYLFGKEGGNVLCSIVYSYKTADLATVSSECLPTEKNMMRAFSMASSLLIAEIYYGRRRDDVRVPL